MAPSSSSSAAGNTWPEQIPSSRFGQLPGHAIDYTSTEPLLAVEVDADVCFEHERWRHTTAFRRVRDDLQPMDLMWSAEATDDAASSEPFRADLRLPSPAADQQLRRRRL